MKWTISTPIIGTLSASTEKLDSERTQLATELREVVGRMIRRLRGEFRMPLTQAAVLGHLDREGTQSIGELAASERVRPQSMSQTLSELEALGLITRAPDSTDGRRTIISLTDLGTAKLLEERARRDGWLANAIAGLTPGERQTLTEATVILRRLADKS
jgi:DNA-binding MarR family transcriptional regulator